MKDDLGSDAIFKEQGSFASQMTAAKVMDPSGWHLVHCRRWRWLVLHAVYRGGFTFGRVKAAVMPARLSL